MSRALDQAGNTVDSFLRTSRVKAGARYNLKRAIVCDGAPETLTSDKSGANLAALHAINAERETPIKIRPIEYLNNIFEQDHRSIKLRRKSMMGFGVSDLLASR